MKMDANKTKLITMHDSELTIKCLCFFIDE